MIPGQFDRLTKALPRQTRRSAMRTLGGLLALVPGTAGANAHQSRGGRAGDDGDGGDGGDDRRRKQPGGGAGAQRRKDHDGGRGRRVCPPTCPRGALTVAPTAQGECRCVPVSPGLRDPAFTCGGRVNATGDGCCFCLYTVEGEGFCAINGSCDLIDAGSITDCTSSGDCPRGRKCVVVNPSFGDTLPAGGVCWPECHTTEGVTPVRS